MKEERTRLTFIYIYLFSVKRTPLYKATYNYTGTIFEKFWVKDPVQDPNCSDLVVLGLYLATLWSLTQ